MADAKALYRRHLKQFQQISSPKTIEDINKSEAVLYAACIIAEAIINGFDEDEGEL